MNKNIKTVLQGMAMGAADIVPGVSGGTIAFIMGIYTQLIESLSRINPSLILRVKEKGLKNSLSYINAGFLFTLGSGILLSIFSLSKLISYLLQTYPIFVYSFFMGLIIASAYLMLQNLKQIHVQHLVMAALGVSAALWLAMQQTFSTEPTFGFLFIAGMISICAMILPGISGSFILLLLGVYQLVLTAVHELNFSILVTLASGALIGLLCFSQILRWLLERAYNATFSFLMGLMLGSLYKVWPWKEAISYRLNTHGEQVPLLEQNITPLKYEIIYQQSPHLVGAVLMICSGALIILCIKKYTQD
tara:strand:+ start:6511 stop:7425 length:915 start_codon:yes stop_codon:yes gene_type:complete